MVENINEHLDDCANLINEIVEMYERAEKNITEIGDRKCNILEELYRKVGRFIMREINIYLEDGTDKKIQLILFNPEARIYLEIAIKYKCPWALYELNHFSTLGIRIPD